MYRHEWKYCINNHDYLLIRNKLKYVMEVDKNAGNHNKYRVTSLYFDDINNSAMMAKLSGALKRSKFRIRIYDHNHKLIKFEKKTKINHLTKKESTRLTEEQYNWIILNKLDFIKPNEILLGEFKNLVKNFLLKPKVIVDYEREAYVKEAGNVRITFDSNLKTSNNGIDLFDRNQSLVNMYDQDTIIMEVKYDEFIPSHIQNIIQVDGRMKTSNSKYLSSRRYTHEFSY